MSLSRRKRASLNLSINAIVVLILAITMLGLGLAFMKKSFGGVTEKFGTVSEEMKQEMLNQLAQEEGRVILSVYSLDMTKGSEDYVYLAIKNDLGIDTDFTICPCDGDPPSTCSCGTTLGEEHTCIVSKEDENDEVYSGTEVEVSTFNQKSVTSGGSEVLPVRVKVSSDAPDGTYYVPIVVEEGGNVYEDVELIINV